MIKPFVKWVGGKTQLLEKIEQNTPETIVTYVEPFVGGGSVLLHFLETRPEIKNFIISDLNNNLIDCYNCIKYNYQYNLLVEQLKHLEEGFNSTDKQKEYYYERRKEYNYLLANPDDSSKKMDGNTMVSSEYLARKSALFMFLNKTGFNGLYRVNKKGEFNVPFNNSKKFNPDFSNLKNLHKLFIERDVNFYCNSYKDCLDNTYYIDDYNPQTTFVYMDPPYKPLTNNGSEVSYTSEGFSDKEQEELKEFCDTLNETGIKFLQSNSDPIDCKFFDNLYCKYRIKRVYARRNINSNGKKRGPITEIMIKNF